MKEFTFKDFQELELLHLLNNLDKLDTKPCSITIVKDTHIDIPTNFEDMIPKDLVSERVNEMNEAQYKRYKDYINIVRKDRRVQDAKD
jgi:hypothetical protein